MSGKVRQLVAQGDVLCFQEVHGREGEVSDVLLVFLVPLFFALSKFSKNTWKPIKAYIFLLIKLCL